MKKTGLIQLVCSIFVFATSCTFYGGNGNFGFGKHLTGNGIIKEQSRGNMDFSAINISGAVDVFISHATDASVMVSGDENLIDSIETRVDDGVLYIRFKKGFGYSSKKGLKVTVPNNGHISSIAASGSSDVLVEKTLTANDLEISCMGSSDFKGAVKAQTCKLTFLGSSDFKGDIQAQECKLSFQGSSDFKGSLEALTCEISCAGSSDCIITGKANTCKAHLSGSCDFKGYDFVVDTLECTSAGSSDVQITCNKELRIRASGSSDVNYKGSAIVADKDLSGSSDLNHR